MDQLGWIQRLAKEKLGKEYSRRDLLKFSGALLGSVALTPDFIKALEYYFKNSSKAELLPTVSSPMQTTSAADIRAENEKKGTTNWRIKKRGFEFIQGYASDISVQPEDWITFYVHSLKPYQMEFYRMGYYQGLGGRHMKTIDGLKSMRQNLIPDPETMECSWAPSWSFRIPSDWLSGMYLNKLVDIDGNESYIIFVVRERIPTADYGVLLATNTYHAYNNWGGKSLYGYNSTNGKQSTHVSFNRPFRYYEGSGLFFQYEYNLLRWLEKEGYSVTYLSDSDIHNGVLNNSQIRALLIAGHAEYWSMEMRKSVEEMSASKINLAVFSANVAYWQVRKSEDNQGRPDRLMTSYKQFAPTQDPYIHKRPDLVTCMWRQSPVNMPEDHMLGIMYSGIPEAPVPLTVVNPNHWLYEGTGLRKGDQIPGVIGGEVDSYRGVIPGVEVIASTPVNLYGQMQKADVAWFNKPTGGKVFAVGTFYWNWFLDSTHYTNRAKENKAIQQITKNALRKLKA